METVSNQPSTLSDTEIFMYMKGDFGSFNGDGVCEWVDSTDSNAFAKVFITDLPVTDTPQTMTIPFCFMSETIPSTFGGTTIKSLKRCRTYVNRYVGSSRGKITP